LSGDSHTAAARNADAWLVGGLWFVVGGSGSPGSC